MALQKVNGLEAPIDGEFYSNVARVEHGCCWGTAVCYKTSMGSRMSGGDQYVLLECSEAEAPFVVNALNKHLKVVRK